MAHAGKDRRRPLGLLRANAPWLAVGAGIGVAFCAVWWALLARNVISPGGVEELVIPAGTADAIERGVPFAFVPERYSFPPGGQLRVVNRDTVEHRIAGTAIPPGSSATVEATESGQLECTVHPAGHLDITLEDRPPWPAMAGLTAMLSLSTAAVAWVIRAGS